MNLKESKKAQNVILNAYKGGYITITEVLEHTSDLQKGVYNHALTKGFLVGAILALIFSLFLK